MAYGIEELKQDILVQLGDKELPVELDNEGMNAVVRRTLETLSKYKPCLTIDSYTVATSGINIHQCDEEVQGIHTIELLPGIPSSQNMQLENAMLSGYPVFYSSGDTAMDMQYLHLRRQWIKTVSREVASDPDYEVVIDPATLRVSIYTYSLNQLWVTAKCIIPYNEDLSNIPFHLRYWTSQWALTEAMKIVGNVRSKYLEVPVADGMVKLNGAQMLAEAAKKQQELLEEIQSSRADLHPRWA